MISAPSASACCAACCAPTRVPPSSFTRSWMSGLLNSASAISAALRIDSAVAPRIALRGQRQDQRDLHLSGADRARLRGRRRRRRAEAEIVRRRECRSTPRRAARAHAAIATRRGALAHKPLRPLAGQGSPSLYATRRRPVIARGASPPHHVIM